jgi:hypothetical protein
MIFNYVGTRFFFIGLLLFEILTFCAMFFAVLQDYSSQKIRVGSGMNTPEIAGTWKQYSHQKIFGFFPMISDHFPPETTGN